MVAASAAAQDPGIPPNGKSQGPVTLVPLVEEDTGTLNALGDLKLPGLGWPAPLLGLMGPRAVCGDSLETAHHREPRASGDFGHRRKTSRFPSCSWSHVSVLLSPQANCPTAVLSLKASLGDPIVKVFSRPWDAPGESEFSLSLS